MAIIYHIFQYYKADPNENTQPRDSFYWKNVCLKYNKSMKVKSVIWFEIYKFTIQAFILDVQVDNSFGYKSLTNFKMS